MQHVGPTSPAASVPPDGPHASRTRGDDVESVGVARIGGPPRLRPWSRVWRYLAAAGIALVLWIAVASDFIPPDETVLPDDVVARIGGAILLDALLGVIAICLLPLRRRRPVLTATLTSAMSAVSAASLGAAVVATVSVATWRRWRWVLPVVFIWAAATVCYELVWRPSIVDETTGAGLAVFSGAFAIAMGAACVTTGFYVGARRELLDTLRVRAETAEREQVLKTEAAREAERTRIAREMHDVLAHRISLVAMHAGVLAYRTDLSREETAETAGVIQRSAHLALTELREVLGVLRADDGSRGADGAEPPQPLVAQVAELVEEAQVEVAAVLDASGLPGGDLRALDELPTTTSRTAYRVVQESLTNVRKHAPGSDAVVLLSGGPGGLLTIEVRNGPPAAAPGRARSSTPGAGYGLLGLAERVELAGGVLEHTAGPDGSFTVRSWLPWQESE